MTINVQTQRVTVPTVFVTKGRQRVKQYGNSVYLKNGDEFEIELFNPTTNKVLAKINLNGNSLGSGIVLRPGERVFLERYLDEAKRFLFETYKVDPNDPNVSEAIKNNGNVEVEFFNECNYSLSLTHDYPCYHYHYYDYPYHYHQYPYITYGSVSNGGGSLYSCSSSTIKSCINEEQTVNTDFSGSIETGRVEKGSNSQQTFQYDSTNFNTYYSWKTTWKILPESQKLFVKEDIKVFCTNCGSKRKKTSHVFCPNCGQKY